MNIRWPDAQSLVGGKSKWYGLHPTQIVDHPDLVKERLRIDNVTESQLSGRKIIWPINLKN
jgi:hypothetical protein